MRINNAIKRASNCSWCKHTDNNYNGRNRKSVRIGKRIIRKKLITYLNRQFMEPNECTCIMCGKDFIDGGDSDLFCSIECYNNQL